VSSASAGLSVRPLDGAGVVAAHDELVGLYARCFAEPPWSEGTDDFAAYAERIREWAARSGFAGLVARSAGGTLVAAAYGWVGRPEVEGVPLPGVGHGPAFHVGDLMVDASARRRGLGRALLDGLVADRRPAVLVTHPDSDARGLYESAGWRRTGALTLPSGVDRVAYVLDDRP
jgi:GNAT superfamily N-acetyltransferase